MLLTDFNDHKIDVAEKYTKIVMIMLLLKFSRKLFKNLKK